MSQHCYMDDVYELAMEYIKEKYPHETEPITGINLQEHIKNCLHTLYDKFFWFDEKHWLPMCYVLKLEDWDEDAAWQRFVRPFDAPDDGDLGIHQRRNFGHFFRRAKFLSRLYSMPRRESFHWLAGGKHYEVWGLMMAEAVTTAEELVELDRREEAFIVLRDAAPLYIIMSQFATPESKTPPKECAPSDEAEEEAWRILALDKEEYDCVINWDDLYEFYRNFDVKPKSVWFSLWQKLGGTRYWEMI